MSTAYPPTAENTAKRIPVRAELLHHLLVRASAGLVALRHDDAGRTVFVDGHPAPLAYTLGVSAFGVLGWLHWWRDAPAPGQADSWWSCHLSPEGQVVLAEWDAQVRRAAAA
jgi:hypothetical protein